MTLRVLNYDFSICKIKSAAAVNMEAEFVFISKTDEELSVVCAASDVPGDCLERSDGWKGLSIQGTLAFSLTGIISGISALLAADGIGIFVVSTYNTDYIFVKREQFGKTLNVLKDAGYTIV